MKMLRSNASAVWAHYQKLSSEKRAKCNYCGEMYSFKSSTHNLKTHLKRRHTAVYTVMYGAELNTKIARAEEPLVEVLDDIKLEPYSFYSNEASTSTDTIQDIVAKNNNATMNTRYRPVQQRLEMNGVDIKLDTSKKTEIDMDLAELFIDGFHSFTLIEERAFKKLIRHIPGYELPSKQTVANILIPAIYAKTVSQKKREVSLIEWISLTTYLWTSSVNNAYLAVTGHFITKDLELQTILLKCSVLQDANNSANIQELLLKTTNEWEITNKINFVVSDSAASVKKAIADIGWTHFGCFARTLNVIVQDALGLVQDSLDKVKATVSRFQESTASQEKLRKTQMQENAEVTAKRLIQDDRTGWTSTFSMLQRFVQLENSLCATVAFYKIDYPVISAEEWTIFRELCTVLETFDEATKAMSSENDVRASSIIVMANCLKEECDDLLTEGFTSETNNVITALRAGLDQRLEDVEKNETFVMSTMLDPRYKINVFSDTNDGENARKVLENAVADIIRRQSKEPEPEISASFPRPTKMKYLCRISNKIGSPHATNQPISRAIREIESYFKDDNLPMTDASSKFNCPLEWWRRNRIIYPNLAVLVPKYANIMATSGPCERIFSETGLKINNCSTEIKARKVEQLVYLNVTSDPKRFDAQEN